MILDSFLKDVVRTVLPNGLTLLTREDRRSAVVAINTWVKAGYFHEPDEVAGMAHLFEHMFFKGSEKFPGAEEIAGHVSRLGGMTNAGTIYDSTNYYFVLPREGFARGVEIQADAIAHPLFDESELRKEAEVVIEESNRKLDNPPAVATERMHEIAFAAHRMRRWRIGSNEVLRNIRRDDLLAFFDTLYRPANIIVTVAGDVSHQEALEVASRTFGAIPAGELRKDRGPSEPPQTGLRFGESFADVKQSHAVFGWHTPGEHHDDEEALDILASLLGSGRSSRLYREAVGPGRASSVIAYNSVFEDVGIFTVRASSEDANLPEVERRVAAEIARMKAFGPTEYELALARNRAESAFVFELEDVLGQAQTLSYFEARGSYLDAGRHLERLASVTATDVMEAARRYLADENLTVYQYRPSGTTPTSRENIALVLNAEAPAGPPSEQPLPPLQPALRRISVSRGLHRFVLNNGLTLFVREEAGTPAVSSHLYFKGGRVREHSGNAGITQLMARAMRKGTTTRSAEQIDREIEFLGTQLSIVVHEDFFGFGIDVLSDWYPSALAILADVVLNPTFPSGGIEEEKHLQLAAIRRSLDSSGDRPFQLFFDLFYGNHPYALPESGYVSSVEGLDDALLRAWWESLVVADEALLVVVGDVAAEDVRDAAESLFGRMRKSVGLHPPVPSFVPAQALLEVVEVRERKQSAIVMGFPSVPPQHPDWSVLRLLQDVTSGLAGTFFRILRSERSLAYSVFAGDSSRELAAAFIGYIATDASKEEAARRGLLEEIRRLGRDGVTEDDLDRARSQLAGGMKIRLQTNAAIAGQIAHNYLFGLGLDFTERFLERVRIITLEEVKTVANRYLSHDNYVIATLRGRG